MMGARCRLLLLLAALSGAAAFSQAFADTPAGTACWPLQRGEFVVYPQGTKVPVKLYQSDKGGLLGSVMPSALGRDVEPCSGWQGNVIKIRLPSDIGIQLEPGKSRTADNTYWVRGDQLRFNQVAAVIKRPTFRCKKSGGKLSCGSQGGSGLPFPPTSGSGGPRPPELLGPSAAAPAPAEREAPAASDHAEQPKISDLRHTGRDLLFSGEAERTGYPLYSYLLDASGIAGGIAQARFAAACEAFVRQVNSAAALESSGAARSEINIFYAPMKPIAQNTAPDTMRVSFAQQSEDDQVKLLLRLYDRARAEVLISRAGLTGDGPYIVSVLRPLSGKPLAAGEAFLVQNLSDVPPELVALWVDEFKRQVVQTAAGNPQALRRFALDLRTKIAVLAESFAITKSAVAAMFEAPKDPTSGGN